MNTLPILEKSIQNAYVGQTQPVPQKIAMPSRHDYSPLLVSMFRMDS